MDQADSIPCQGVRDRFEVQARWSDKISVTQNALFAAEKLANAGWTGGENRPQGRSVVYFSVVQWRPFSPFFCGAAPLKKGRPQKGSLFSMVTEQLRLPLAQWVASFLLFFWGRVVFVNSTKPRRMPFIPMATGHLSTWVFDSPS